MATRKGVDSAVPAFILCLLCALIVPAGAVFGNTAPGRLPGEVCSLAVPFIANTGQVKNDSIKFYSRISGGTVSVAGDGELTYQLGNDKANPLVIREKLLSASVARVRGAEQALARLSFIKGRDPLRWRTGVPTYSRLSLGNVYQGIALELKSSGKAAEKVFYVQPGARPDLIRMQVTGVKRLTINGRGQLELRTAYGRVAFSRPIAYQETERGRQYVPASYTVKGTTYGFQVGSYDRSRELVIDPLLGATFIGGSDEDDRARSMAIDSQGNVYITGHTRSAEFPVTSGAYGQAYNDADDVFIAKFDSDLKNLLAATYYGGEADDEALSIALDSSGNVCIAGSTGSWELPTTLGAFQPEHVMGRVGRDGFVATFDSSLQNLVAATYLSGSDGGAEDEVFCMTIAPGGAIYVGGLTDSPNFPVKPGCYKTDHPASPNGINPGCQGFVVKLSADLTSMLAGTFFGPDDDCAQVYGIALDKSENVYITGETDSTSFPTTEGAYDRVLNDGKGESTDLYIAKLDKDLTSLLAATLLGGSSTDQIGYDDPQRTDKVLIIEPDGNVLLTAGTSSEDFPTTPGALITSRDYGAVVARLNSTLEKLLASTYLCASNDSSSVVLDSAGNIIVAGNSEYACPTPASAFQTEEDEWGGAFISKLSSDLTTLLAATFIGGSESDAALSVAVDSGDKIYITGWTESSDFPVTDGAYRTAFDGETREAYVAKFDPALSSSSATTTIPSECPIEATVGRERLGPFYALKAALARSSAGQAYIDIYYCHAREVVTILRSHPELAAAMNRLLIDSIPAVCRYAQAGAASVPDALIVRATSLMEKVMSCGSARLQKDLRRIVKDLRSGGLFNMLPKGK